MDREWNNLLSQYRSLGGDAQNIFQQYGENGRGIFPIESDCISRILIPSCLMIKPEDIYISGDNIRILQNRNYDKKIIDFFHYYQDHFSWGQGGKEVSENFLQSLLAFPSSIKILLKEYNIFDIDQLNDIDLKRNILKQFLQARQVMFRGNLRIIPVLELINHDVQSAKPFNVKGGMSSPIYPASSKELTFNYGYSSPLRRFLQYGFFSQETIIFSIPFELNIDDSSFTLICNGKDIKDDSMCRNVLEKLVTIEGMPISDKNFPNLPTNYFCKLFLGIFSQEQSKDIFKQILELNISFRKKINEEINSSHNSINSEFTKTIQYELNTLLND